MKLTSGDGCEKNIDLAIQLYNEAIDLKCSVVSNQSLGFIYRDLGDFEKAFKYYCDAEEFDNADNPEIIANCYYYGIGVQTDKIKAFEMFKEIVQKNNPKATFQYANYILGIIYLEGVIIEKSIMMAKYHFELANEDNNHQNSQQLLLIIGRK